MKKFIFIISIFIILKLSLSANFIRDDEYDIVTDTRHRIMWQDNNETINFIRTWRNALNHCYNLKLAGYKDWRLPSLKELETTVSYKNNGVIDKSFKYITDNHFWSNSWHVKFSSGVQDFYLKNRYNDYANILAYARCVRSIDR